MMQRKAGTSKPEWTTMAFGGFRMQSRGPVTLSSGRIMPALTITFAAISGCVQTGTVLALPNILHVLPRNRILGGRAVGRHKLAPQEISAFNFLSTLPTPRRPRLPPQHEHARAYLTQHIRIGNVSLHRCKAAMLARLADRCNTSKA